jgi:lambda family phage tail tape measure protein
MAERQIREIIVKSDIKGEASVRNLAKGFSDLNSSVKKTTSVLESFKTAFFALSGLTIAGFGLRELGNTLDGMQKLTDRLTIIEGTAAGARRSIGELTTVANANQVSTEDLATVYVRLSNSLRDTGITTNALIGFTDILIKTFRLSGATAAEATASTIQLSQGLASGQLRGQELRSVLEQNSLAGEILSKQLGITRGQLLKFAEKNNGISADQVLAAFANAGDRVTEMANKLRPTIGEALTTAFNDLKLQLNDVNREFGLTELAVGTIQYVSKNISDLAKAVTVAWIAWKAYTNWQTLATAATVRFGQVLASGVLGVLVKVGIAVAAFFSTPIVAATAVVAALVSGLVLAVSFSEKFRDSIAGTGRAIGEYFRAFREGDTLQGALSRSAKAFKGLSDESTKVQQNFVLLDRGLPPINAQFEKIVQGKVDTRISSFGEALQGFSKTLTASKAEVFNYKTELAKLNEEFLKDKNTAKYNAAVKKIDIKKLNEDFSKGAFKLDVYNKKLYEINFGKARDETRNQEVALAALNKKYTDGALTLTEYSAALDDLTLDKTGAALRRGKQNILDFNKALADSQIKDIRRAFAEGTIDFQQFSGAIRAVDIESLNNQFKAGLIDINEYNAAIVKVSETFRPGSVFSNGLTDYIRSAGTLSQSVSTAITNTFGNLENTFVEFTKTGKFAFKDFATSVLDDLNKIIVRSLIIRPLAQGILSNIGGGVDAAGGTTQYSSDYLAQAKGGMWEGGYKKFAQGGVVNRDTPFLYSGGRKGVMGEAGPEAILPLARGKNGDLGVQASAVKVQVNVINNTNADVETRESTDQNGTKVIDFIINQKVKEGLAAGIYDRELANGFGLKRRGY